MTRTFKALFVLMAGLSATVLALVLEAEGSYTTNTENIAVGEITGTHGDEGAAGYTGQHTVGRKYGFHCSGKTCTGDDDPPACVNHLTMTFVRDIEEGETQLLFVQAMSGIRSKESKLTSRDWDCPVGPPTWNASGSIKVSDPGAGSAGSNESAGGSIEDVFSHTTNPTTSWAKAWNQTPVPTGTNGTTYANEGLLKQWPWNYDPENPSTTSFVVRADVTTDFAGSAVEIEVVECYLRADCYLYALAFSS